MQEIYRDEPKFHNGKGDPKRFIGIEFEIAGHSIKREKVIEDIANKWGCEIGDDGSILFECIFTKTHKDHCTCSRGNDWTFELKTAPAKGDKFCEQINELCAAFKEAKCKINNSCAMHCHIDARDLSPDGLMKAALLWSKIEPKMFKIVAPHRRKNPYCSHMAGILRKSKLDKLGIKTFMNLNDNIAGQFNHRGAFNIAALEDHGTIENRMHEATLDPKEIIKWATLNSNILEFAQNSSVKEIKAIRSLNPLMEYHV